MKKLVALVLLLLCGCQLQVHHNQRPLPPVPFPAVRSKAALPTGPAKAKGLGQLLLTWQPSDLVTVETSPDLRAWNALTNTVLAALAIAADQPAAFFRVKALQRITLAWDASTTPGVSYRLYVGSFSRGYTNAINLGPVLYTTFTGRPGDTNYFALTAYNANGLESAYSQEVSYVYPTNFWTPVPARLTIP